MRTITVSARSSALLVAVLAAGCAHHPNPVAEPPHSLAEHLALADKCEAEAAREERAAKVANEGRQTYVCSDGGMASQTTSGGEQLTRWAPCWSYDRVRSAAHEEEAERLRAEARQHRAMARTLVDVERTFCATIVEKDLDHTPFFHRDDIAYAVAERAGERIIGAAVTFKPIPGLDAAWMRMALACHHARAATLGYPATYMSYDPSVLEHARTTVDDRDGHVVVTIVADDEVDAAVAWSRAAALCGPMPIE